MLDLKRHPLEIVCRHCNVRLSSFLVPVIVNQMVEGILRVLIATGVYPSFPIPTSHPLLLCFIYNAKKKVFGDIRAGIKVGWNWQLSAVKYFHQWGLRESGDSRKGKDEVILFINVFPHSLSVPCRYLSSADGSAYWWRHGASMKNAGSGWAPWRHRVCFLFY